jgi:hypothetical protein
VLRLAARLPGEQPVRHLPPAGVTGFQVGVADRRAAPDQELHQLQLALPRRQLDRGPAVVPFGRVAAAVQPLVQGVEVAAAHGRDPGGRRAGFPGEAVQERPEGLADGVDGVVVRFELGMVA